MAPADASLAQASTWTPSDLHEILGLDHDVEEMRDRRALIAADVTDARLQEGLGHGQYALAAKDLALAELEQFDLFLERAFHRVPGRLAVRSPTGDYARNARRATGRFLAGAGCARRKAARSIVPVEITG